jgi:ribosomal protein L15E
LVRVSRSAYILFLTDRIESPDYRGKTGPENFPAIGREWIALPQAEKEVRNLGSIDIYWILQMLTVNPALPQIANRRSPTV